MHRGSAAENFERSVSLSRYWLKSPLVFSFDLHGHDHRGSQRQIGMPVAMVIPAWTTEPLGLGSLAPAPEWSVNAVIPLTYHAVPEIV